ncbi:hypothetical protein Syun_018867 [Stephania yunnanensis]|uniref:Uncharacterized protein n=1 Tax=Stephania yunnanensis TaxID=152371 RepID=A0AAP0ITP8_9MAGN
MAPFGIFLDCSSSEPTVPNGLGAVEVALTYRTSVRHLYILSGLEPTCRVSRPLTPYILLPGHLVSIDDHCSILLFFISTLFLSRMIYGLVYCLS